MKHTSAIMLLILGLCGTASYAQDSSTTVHTSTIVKTSKAQSNNTGHKSIAGATAGFVDRSAKTTVGLADRTAKTSVGLADRSAKIGIGFTDRAAKTTIGLPIKAVKETVKAVSP